MALCRSRSPQGRRGDPVAVSMGETVAVTVRAAADGDVLLPECEVSRANMIEEIHRRLLHDKWEDFLVVIIHKNNVLSVGDVLQEERVELSAMFRTQYQIDDYFPGFECEVPVGPGWIPDGSHWVPGRAQGEYQLKWNDAGRPDLVRHTQRNGRRLKSRLMPD